MSNQRFVDEAPRGNYEFIETKTVQKLDFKIFKYKHQATYHVEVYLTWGSSLGTIVWHSQFNKYVFRAESGVVLTSKSLLEISKYMDELTVEYKVRFDKLTDKILYNE